MYARLMRPAPEGCLTGEASTGYTKRPDTEGCADRALRVLGPELRLVYVERDPISRAISHYRHEFVDGTTKLSIDEALRNDPRYVDYGRYDWQLEPWKAVFGSEQILRIRFEDYVADRQAVVAQIAAHIGADPAELPKLDTTVHNSSSDKHVATGVMKHIVASHAFQYWIKPLFSQKFRRAILPLLAGKAKASEKTITQETQEILQQRFSAKP